jgi:hypothetical protein
MKASRPLASHALTIFLLVGLVIVVFSRVRVVRQFHINAPGCPRPLTNQSVKTDWPFRFEGCAMVDCNWPTSSDGIVVRPESDSQAGAAVEPTAHAPGINCLSARWRAHQGVLRVVRGFGRQFGELTLDDGGGNLIRLIFRLDADRVHGGFSGFYQISGGKGRFEHATGEGAYHLASATPRDNETMSDSLEGAISF